jgi:NADH dehydrogenase
MGIGGKRPWRVLVLGGGFGGLYAATYLARSFDLEPEDEVLLVDARNHFTFTPLLSEVVAGTLGREHVAVPLRSLARKNGFRFLQAHVEGLDPDAAVAYTSVGPIGYDRCILSLGSRSRFFGNEALAEHSFPLKSLGDALALRDRIIALSEAAAVEKDPGTRRELLTFIVAGAGPAGVETASEIHHLFRDVLPAYYPEGLTARVLLVEGSGRILRQFDKELAKRGGHDLADSGVEIRLGTRIESATDRSVRLSDGETIPARTLIWTAGIEAHPLGSDTGFATERDGSVMADEFLRVGRHEDVYAVGDMASVRNPRSDRPYPKVAPIAISQGVRAAANIENDRAGRPAEPYAAHHAGKIVSVGAGRALVDILGLRVVGRPAWLIYRTAYILKMVGLRNKLQVAFTLAMNRIFERDLTTVVPASSTNGRPTARDGSATVTDGSATGVASGEELV